MPRIPAILAAPEIAPPRVSWWRRALLWLLGAPQGRRTFDLLRQEILAEVTIFLMDSGQRKSIISKIEDAPDRQLRQQLVQALLFTAIDVAKERAIGINWQALNGVYPYQGPPGGPPAPPPAPEA